MRLPEVVLKDAAAYIEQHGWRKLGLVNHFTGEVCAVGAIRAVCGILHDPAWNTEAVKAADLLLERLAAAGVNDDIPDWNDALGRTKAEVLSMLRGES